MSSESLQRPGLGEAAALIAAAAAECELEVSLRSAVPAAWDEVWNALGYRPVAASAGMMEYQASYLRGAGHAVEEVSLVLRTDGRAAGLLPLALTANDGKLALNSLGATIAAPLFIGGISPRTVKKFCTRLIATLCAFARRYGIECLELEQGAWPGAAAAGCTEWHQQLLIAGAIHGARHDLYADLSPPLPEIRAVFRKSFRPLINVALRTWNVAVMDAGNADAATWAAFKQLHRDVAGRATRSDESWDRQWQLVLAREAFVVTLREPTAGTLVGAALFQHTRDEGLYAVAAYDRALFDKPLGHAAQQKAIEALKDLGVRWYLIGERHYTQAPHAPTQKEVAISEFKQGFASHLFARPQFQLSTRQEGPRDADGA